MNNVQADAIIQAIAWSLTSLAFALTVGRFWIRWRRAKGIKLDDLLNALALVALLAFVATATAYFPVAYAAEYFKLGFSTTSPTQEELVYAFRLKFANGLLFWITIYAYYFSSFAEANAAWTIIEPTLAVIVCASPSYRTLLSSRSRARVPPYEDMQPYNASMGQHSEKSKTRQELLEMDSMNEQSIHSSV